MELNSECKVRWCISLCSISWETAQKLSCIQVWTAALFAGASATRTPQQSKVGAGGKAESPAVRWEQPLYSKLKHLPVLGPSLQQWSLRRPPREKVQRKQFNDSPMGNREGACCRLWSVTAAAVLLSVQSCLQSICHPMLNARNGISTRMVCASGSWGHHRLAHPAWPSLGWSEEEP